MPITKAVEKEKTSPEVICGAPKTLAVKGEMMMMMMMMVVVVVVVVTTQI